MKQLQPDLWQSSRHESGMLRSHAYLVTRPAGNVLLYNIGLDQQSDLDAITELGGVAHQLLSHRDEANELLDPIRHRFGSRLWCSAIEAPAIGRAATVDTVLAQGDDHVEDVEVLHTPGHTDGSLCFFYRSPHGKSYLFTGDSLFLWDGEWSTLVLEAAGGSATALAGSLLGLRALRPDLVLCSAFVGDVATMEVGAEEWTRAIDGQVARLRNA